MVSDINCILVDEDLTPTIAKTLWHQYATQAETVRDLGKSGDPDYKIWEYAVKHNRTIITGNVKHFKNLAKINANDGHRGLIFLDSSVSSRRADAHLAGLRAAIDHIKSIQHMIDYAVEVSMVTSNPQQLQSNEKSYPTVIKDKHQNDIHVWMITKEFACP